MLVLYFLYNHFLYNNFPVFIIFYFSCLIALARILMWLLRVAVFRYCQWAVSLSYNSVLEFLLYAQKDRYSQLRIFLWSHLELMISYIVNNIMYNSKGQLWKMAISLPQELWISYISLYNIHAYLIVFSFSSAPEQKSVLVLATQLDFLSVSRKSFIFSFPSVLLGQNQIRPLYIY